MGIFPEMPKRFYVDRGGNEAILPDIKDVLKYDADLHVLTMRRGENLVWFEDDHGRLTQELHLGDNDAADLLAHDLVNVRGLNLKEDENVPYCWHVVR